MVRFHYSPPVTEYSTVWQCAAFGTQRSKVRILVLRPITEDCQSGRSELPAKELNRKVPWVRIPHLPPTYIKPFTFATQKNPPESAISKIIPTLNAIVIVDSLALALAFFRLVACIFKPALYCFLNLQKST